MRFETADTRPSYKICHILRPCLDLPRIDRVMIDCAFSHLEKSVTNQLLYYMACVMRDSSLKKIDYFSTIDGTSPLA